MTRLTILQKGLILVSVPLLFQLGLLGLLADAQRRNREAQQWSLHTKDVLNQSQTILAAVAFAETGMRAYVASGEEALAKPFEQSARLLPSLLKKLASGVRDNPEQQARARQVADAAFQLLKFYAAQERLIRAGKREEALARMAAHEGKPRMDAFRAELAAFDAEEERLESNRLAALAASEKRLNWILACGAFCSILVTFGLAAAFTRGIGKRLQEVARGTRLSARGGELKPPMAGNDEIAALDRAVRSYIDEIRELNDNLERRVQERTCELEETNRQLQRQIDERQRVEAAMRESEERFRLLATCAPIGIFQCDREGRAVYLNPDCERTLGITTAECAAGKWVDVLHPHDREAVVNGWGAAVRDGTDFHIECRYQRPDQSVVWADIRSTTLRDAAGAIAGFIGTLIDVTARRQAEEQAELLRRRFEQILNAAGEGIYGVDMQGNTTFMNPAGAKMLGWDVADLIGRSIHACVHHTKPDGSPYPAEECPIYAALKDGKVHHADDEVFWRKDGSSFPIEYVSTPKIDNGQLKGAVVVFRDNSERKMAETKLRQQVGRLHLVNEITRAIGERHDMQSIFRVVLAELEENLPIDLDCFCLFNRDTNTLAVAAVGPRSQELSTRVGLHEGAALSVDANALGACVRGKTVYDPDLTEVDFPVPRRLADAGLRSLAAAPLAREGKTFGILLCARRRPHSFSSGDCEFLKQVSEHVYLAALHAQLYSDLKRAYEDLRQSQETVMQQERLRALGQMASGIAHDINNAISPVAIYTESLLEREPNLSPRGRKYLTTIQQAIDDVARTVSRMREFYRKQEDRAELLPVQLNQLVEHVVDLTRAKWRDLAQQKGVTIDVKTELAADLPAVAGAENEIREALTNLIFNAVDAMPKGGTLTIRTYAGTRDSTLQEWGSATHAVVEVADSGIGMSEETRRRCLEPFYTTKGERGTGLGLAMVYGTMQRHSGDIEIHSEVGAGTTIRLLFLLPASVMDMKSPVEASAEVQRSLRILTVDDDALLRRSLQDSLEADGHVVVATDGGQAGIDQFRSTLERGEHFDVVITDLGMPHVDGREVARAVKELSPATPVILLTGWGQRMKQTHDLPIHVDGILPKPPRLKALRAALAAVANGRRTLV